MNNYERLYHAAIESLAAIAKASGIPDEDAAVSGPEETQFQVEQLVSLAMNAVDNLSDMPISEEWAKSWCEHVLALLPPNT